MLIVILLGNNVFAYDFSAVCSTGQTLYYTITSDTEPYTVEVVSEIESSPYYNTSPTGDLEIPETVEYNSITYSVTRIGDHAFKSCNGLTSLEIPNSVTTIGEEAFYQCSGIAGSLTLSNSVTTIGRYSFGTCSGLETITIGSAMDSIAGRAFYNCSSLTTVNFNAVNCRYIGDYNAGLYAFTGCSAAATLNIDENVTYIAGYGFCDWSGLTTVNYNATNSTSSNYIWRDCTSFTSLNIGENVTAIPANLFSGSNITSVIIPNAVTVIGLSAFSSCSALETVTIGYAVDSMAERAFYDCDALTTINYNATNCRECGGTTWTAFSNCDAVRNLNIGENVTNIPAYLFKDLYALNTVTIPSSVTSIGDYAFRYVKNINYSGTATGSPWGAITVNGYEEGDLVYSDDTKTQLTGCSIFATSATIQNTVTSIGDYAFYKCAQLTDISIPNTVIEIGNKVFYGCDGLTEPVYNDTYFVYLPTGYASSEYTIPNGIKHIAGSAFYDCDGLTAITIPNTVTSIGEWAFYSCGGLTSVTINDSITSIGDGAFQSCSNLATVNFNATNCTTMAPNSLYTVFNYCSSLTTLNIGENVKIIPDYAFKCCRSLTEVTIPDSVTSIGFQAFSLCDALTTVNYNATNCTANGTVFQGSSALSTVNFGENVKNIPEYAFSGCTGLTEITLPDSLVNIGSYAFSSCSGLTEITIPDSVTSIGDRAFQNCSGLTTINFNAKNCTTMGNSSVNPVFYNCTSLATVNVGENVTNIPSCAFYDCSSLTSVTFGNSVTNIGSYAFSSCSGLTEITIPDSVTSIGERAFQNCSGLTTVNFNATNCTTMGSSSNPVFYNCTSLATINISEGVTNIPSYAFYQCSALTRVNYSGTITQWCGITFGAPGPLYDAHNLYINNSLVTDLVIPDIVTEINDYAFRGATCLTSVTIPESITNIGTAAFSSCSELTTVNFNAINCTTMGSAGVSVFSSCTSLSTLNIGDNVKNIPANAFKNCSGLETITIGNSIESIGNYAFSDCSSLTSVYVNDISKWCAISFDGLSTYANPLGLAHNLYINNELVTDLVLPDAITEIKPYVFQNATCLTSVTIPGSVTSIGSQAFYGCTSLATVNFNAENCTTMGSLSSPAFFNCTSITTLNIGERVKNIPNNAFRECTGLIEITIPDSIISIGEWAFGVCSGLTTVNFNPKNCTTMGSSARPAFYNCSSFANLNIGERVKTIPDNAFSGCSGLTEITIPDSVTFIGDLAFSGCTGLTTVNFNATNCTSMGTTNYAAFYNGSFSILNIGERVKNIPDYAFYHCSGLTEITIPDSVTSIGGYAFSDCTGLTTVNFNAENCTSMGGTSTFSNCTFTTLNIGERVKSIPNYAFYDCSGLTGSLTIPDSVTNIGSYAFSGCTGISEITIPNSVTSIGDKTFDGCTGLNTVNFNAENCTTAGTTNYSSFSNGTFTTLNIGNNVKNIPQYTFYGCTGLTEIIISDSVTNIGTYAFYNCSGCEVLTIGKSVETIGTDAFSGCNFSTLNYNTANCSSTPFANNTNITTLTIGADVESIPEGAFSSCTGIATVNFNATNCTSMESYSNPVFSTCSSLSTLNIGENVINIPNYAFKNCSSLTGSLIIPNSVTIIGKEAFLGCDGFTSVYIGNSVDSVKSHALSCTGLTAVYYAGSLAEWCAISFEWDGSSNPLSYAHNLYINNELVTDLVIPETVTEIKAYAFRNATCLSSVTIPNSVTSIETSVFYGCSGLTAVYYTGNIDEWCGILFANETANPLYNAHNLYINNELVTSLVIPETVTEIKQYAFYGASALTSVTFPNTLLSIGIDAFDSCIGLSEITIPNSVTSIANIAFWACSGLTTVKIGNSVENIGSSAFSQCENITEIYITANTPPVLEGTSVFMPIVRSSASLYVPCNASDAYSSADGWSDITNIQERFDYTLTVSSDNEQQGTASVTQQPSCSDNNGTISATPATGYRFLSWNDGNEDNPRTVIVTSDSTFTAGFRAIHTITATAGENGSIDPSGEITLDEGENQSFTITPAEGYRIASVMVDDVDATDQLVEGVYTFENVTANHTIEATFEEIPSFTITVSANNDEYGSVSGGGTYEEGAEVIITATPNEGYQFVSWSDDNTDNPRTITVTSDSTFVADFVREFADTIILTDYNGNTYDINALLDDDKYIVFNFFFTTCQYSQEEVPGVVTLYTQMGCNSGDVIIMALEVTDHDADHDIDWYMTEFGAIYPIVPLESNPINETLFNNWGLDGTPTYICISPDRSMRELNRPLNYEELVALGAHERECQEQQQYTITVSANNDEYGTVTGGGTYEEGSEVVITATPNEGYQFVSWNDDNTENPRTITVTSDSTFVAIFEVEPLQQYTITVLSNDEEYGMVSGGGTYDEGSTVIITAIPNIGYCFLTWSDGNMDNPREITVTGDRTYTAYFTASTHVEIDTTVTKYLSIYERTFYVAGQYSFVVPSAEGCDTIVDLNLRILDEPETYEISPNPAKSLINISSEDYISFVEFYSTAGRLVMREEINAYRAEINVEAFMPGVYFIRLYGEDESLPSVQRFVKE